MNRRGGRGPGVRKGRVRPRGTQGAASGIGGCGAAGRGWFHFHRRIIGKYENNILTR